MEYSYVVTGPGGNVVLQAAAGCRYPKETERDLLESGYQIRLDGRKLTKKEIKGVSQGFPSSAPSGHLPPGEGMAAAPREGCGDG